MCRRFGFLALLLMPSGLRADETHAILLRELGVGDSVRVEKVEKTTGATKVTDPQGKVLINHDDETTTRLVYDETVLEQKGGARPTRLRRKYEEAKTTSRGKTENLPFAGKTVLIEKKGGGYVFRIEGGKELKGEDAKLLEQEFNSESDPAAFEKMLLPDKPVALAAPWKLNLGPLVKEFERSSRLQADADKSTGTGTLSRVYEKEGHKHGRINVAVDMPLKVLGEGKQRLEVQAGSKASFEGLLDVCIDGKLQSGTVKATFRLNATADVGVPDGGKGKMTVRIEAVTEETRKELPKSPNP
jgi:hypothetical protein